MSRTDEICRKCGNPDCKTIESPEGFFVMYPCVIIKLERVKENAK